MATKAELQYDFETCQANHVVVRKMLSEHSYREAIYHGLKSLPMQAGSIAFQRRYASGTEIQTRSLETALLYSPAFFDQNPIRQINEWYFAQSKSIRASASTVYEMLDTARFLFDLAMLTWGQLSERPLKAVTLSGHRLDTAHLRKTWLAAGLVIAVASPAQDRVIKASDFEKPATTKCKNCGAQREMKLADALQKWVLFKVQ